MEVVSTQASKHRDPTKKRAGGFLGSEGMTMMQLYPVYDRLVREVVYVKHCCTRVCYLYANVVFVCLLVGSSFPLCLMRMTMKDAAIMRTICSDSSE